jgi:hypothetical protein
LPDPTRLETMLLSRDSAQVEQVAGGYQSVYLQVPIPAAAPLVRRNLMDMHDAVAMAAMKRSIQIDALAELELEAADTLANQLRDAAPGTAPMVEAQVTAWMMRSQAYTQSALSELVRLRSAQLAMESAELKLGTLSTTGTRNNVDQILNAR